MKKLIAAMAALAMLAAISTTALAADVPSGTPSNVLATTSQTDTYSADIAWGGMTFVYNFGTWLPGTHAWSAEGWVATGFAGANDMVTVTNNSSLPINATFSYARDSAIGGLTAGTFTKVSGNLNNLTDITTGPTGIMALDLCAVGATGTAIPFGETYLNLQNRPAASIKTAAKIGTITVTLSPSSTGATTELALVTDAVVTAIPSVTVNTKVDVEAAMLVLANAKVATGYIVTIATGPVSTYDLTTHIWTGSFTVTNNNNVSNTKTDTDTRSITVVTAS